MPTVNEQYKISIEAKLSKSMAKLNKFKLRVDKITVAIAKATAAIKAFAASVVVALTAGLYAFKKLLDVMDETIKKARSLNITVRVWQKLTFVFEQSGLSAAKGGKAIFNMQKIIGKAGRGEKIYIKLLEDMGTSYEELMKLSPEDQFLTMIDLLKKIEDPAIRAAIANDLFGLSAKELGTLMKGGSEGVKELMEQAVKFGIVMDKNILEQAERSNDAINLLWKTIRAQFARGLGETDFVEKWALGLAEFVARFPANLVILRQHIANFDILNPFASWNTSLKDALKGVGADTVAKIFSAVAVYKAVKALIKFLGARMLLAVATSFSTGGLVGEAVKTLLSWFRKKMIAAVAFAFATGGTIGDALTTLALFLRKKLAAAVAFSFASGGAVGTAITTLMTFLRTRMTVAVAASFALGGAVGTAITSMIAFFRTRLVAATAASFAFGATGGAALISSIKGLVARVALILAPVGVSILSGPVGWALLGGVAIGALVYNYWDDISKFFVGLYDDMVAWFGTVDWSKAWTFLLPGGLMLSLWEDDIRPGLESMWTNMVNWFKNTNFASLWDGLVPDWVSNLFSTGVPVNNPNTPKTDDSGREDIGDGFFIPAGATGGKVSGSGTGTSDSILARLSNGEFVVNAKAAKKNYGLLEAINKGLPGFAEGGAVNIDREALSAATGITDPAMLDYLIKNGGYALETLVNGYMEFIANGQDASIVIGAINDNVEPLTITFQDLIDQGIDPLADSLDTLKSKFDEQLGAGTFDKFRSNVRSNLAKAFEDGDFKSAIKGIFQNVASMFANRAAKSFDKLLFGDADGAGGLISSIFGFAKGGIVPKPGQRPQYFANGGMARGTDTIPAMLTPGEVVLNKKQQGMLSGSSVVNVYNTINAPLGVDEKVSRFIAKETEKTIISNPDLVSTSNNIQSRRNRTFGGG